MNDNPYTALVSVMTAKARRERYFQVLAHMTAYGGDVLAPQTLRDELDALRPYIIQAKRPGERPATDQIVIQTGDEFALHDRAGITLCRARIEQGALILVREDGTEITIMRAD